MTALHPLAHGVEHPSPLRRNAAPWLLIVGLFAAPLAWWLQLLCSYALNGDSCLDGGIAVPTISPKAIIAAAIGLVAILCCFGGLLAAHRTWQLTRKEAPGDHNAALTTGIGRTRFLGLCGSVASAIFLVAAVCEMLVPLLVLPCANSLP